MLQNILNSGRDPERTPPELLRRYRYLNITLLAMAALGVPYVPVYVVAGLYWSALTVSTSILVAVIVVFALRGGFDLRLAGYVGTVAVYVSLLVCSFAVGGLDASASAWWVLMPTLSALLVGIRAGMVWAGITILTILLTALGHYEGIIPERLPGAIYYIHSVVGMVGGIIAATAISIAFVVQAHAAHARLQDSLEALRTENGSRLQAELQARQALAARSRFLAMMSHEIRTPLNGVLGMNQLLAETKLSGDQRQMLDTALGATRSLQSILDDVLDFSKLDAGRVVLEKVPFEPGRLVKECARLFQGKAEEKRIKLVAKVAPGAPAWVQGDPTRLRQVLLNLLSNAVKFTEQGEIQLSLTMVQEHLHFKVLDTGVGISEEAQQRLFQPFIQAEDSTNRRFGGTGLGLSICKDLVDLMGGQLGLKSTLGEGSCFTVKVDLPKVKPPGTIQKIAREGDSAPLRILVAEDNPVNQVVAKRLLERHGHAVQMVSTGRQAVDAAAGGAFEMVLMDMQMPDMDGLEATRQIRALPSEISQVPIIALTANASTEDRAACSAAGMNDFIAKPFDFERFKATLERWRPSA